MFVFFAIKSKEVTVTALEIFNMVSVGPNPISPLADLPYLTRCENQGLCRHSSVRARMLTPTPFSVSKHTLLLTKTNPESVTKI